MRVHESWRGRRVAAFVARKPRVGDRQQRLPFFVAQIPLVSLFLLHAFPQFLRFSVTLSSVIAARSHRLVFGASDLTFSWRYKGLIPWECYRVPVCRVLELQGRFVYLIRSMPHVFLRPVSHAMSCVFLCAVDRGALTFCFHGGNELRFNCEAEIGGNVEGSFQRCAPSSDETAADTVAPAELQILPGKWNVCAFLYWNVVFWLRFRGLKSNHSSLVLGMGSFFELWVLRWYSRLTGSKPYACSRWPVTSYRFLGSRL